MPYCTFLGHSCVRITQGDTTLLIDPFLTGNPLASESADQQNPTSILLTHAHNDHIGDAVGIAKRCGANVIGIHEIAVWAEEQGLATHGMSIGGAHSFPWGWVKMTPAWHGSTYQTDGGLVTLGMPAGFLIKLDGKTIYHAGDTGLFLDLELIGRAGIDLAFLPIGDNYTMGPDDALEAVKLLKPRVVVPIHYNTFSLLEQDGAAWAKRVRAETDAAARELQPGESVEA